MKKKVIIISAIIFLLILLFPIKRQLKDGGTIEYNAILYKIIKYHQLDTYSSTGYKEGVEIKILNFSIYKNIKKEKAKEQETQKQEKQLIKLDRFDDYGESESEVTTLECSFDNVNLSETSKKTFENEMILLEYTNFIKSKLNVNIDGKWKYSVHYYNEDSKDGLLTFMYYIDEIATNKCILFAINNGKINEVYYSYLEETTDEDELITKLHRFKENYVQEKKEAFLENEKFLEERISYTYYYQLDKLVYVYALFYYEGKLINNDHGSVIVIE